MSYDGGGFSGEGCWYGRREKIRIYLFSFYYRSEIFLSFKVDFCLN